MVVCYEGVGIIMNFGPGGWSFIEKSTTQDPSNPGAPGNAAIVYCFSGGVAKQIGFRSVEERDRHFDELAATLKSGEAPGMIRRPSQILVPR